MSNKKKSSWEQLDEAMTPVKGDGWRPPAYLPGVSDPNSSTRPGKKQPMKKEAQFGLGKSGDPKHLQDPEEMPGQEPMRRSRADAYNHGPQTNSPQKSRRDHMAGRPVEEDDGEGGMTFAFSLDGSDDEMGSDCAPPMGPSNPWAHAATGIKAIKPTGPVPAKTDGDDDGHDDAGTIPPEVHSPDGPSLSPEDAVRALVRKKVKEVVRKKKGGGYALYSPNMGKKKPAKKVGEFPTRGQAKKAEMLRFPPKDIKKRKALKKTVDRLKNKREGVEHESYLEELRDRLAEAAEDALDDKEAEKDTATPPEEPEGTSPEDAAADLDAAPADDAEMGDAEMDAPVDDPEAEPADPVEPSVRPATAPQEESPWEDLLSKLSDVAVKKDPKLRKLVKKVGNATERALEKSVKTLGRLTSGVKAGKVGKDRVGRPYITATIELKSGDVGPVFIYVKGETLHVVSDGKVKSSIMKLDPDEAREVKQALKDLPDRFDSRDLEKAVALRDKYLEEMELDLDGYLSELDALELSMLKRLVADKYSGDEDPIE